MKPDLNDIYMDFCLSHEIEGPYMDEELNYRVAFDKWIQEQEYPAGKVSEEDWEQFKLEVDNFVTDYMTQYARVKPIGTAS